MLVPFKSIGIGQSFIDSDAIDDARRGLRGPLPLWTKSSPDTASHGSTDGFHYFPADILVFEVTIP